MIFSQMNTDILFIVLESHLCHLWIKKIRVSSVMKIRGKKK